MKKPTERLIIVVFMVFALALLALIVVTPNFVNGGPSPINACINNLRMLDGAIQQWALDNEKSEDATPTWDDILPYLSRQPEKPDRSERPKCPQGGEYSLGSVTNPPTCSIPNHQL